MIVIFMLNNFVAFTTAVNFHPEFFTLRTGVVVFWIATSCKMLFTSDILTPTTPAPIMNSNSKFHYHPKQVFK